MRTNKLIIYALILCFGASFQSCKKGDDDPFISLRSRANRIEGKWTVDKYFIDGSDELNYSGSSEFPDEYKGECEELESAYFTNTYVT